MAHVPALSRRSIRDRLPRLQRLAGRASPTPVTMSAYPATGHWWESVFENWESEFLQMAVFVLLTTVLVQKGSPESRRPHIKEPSMPIRATSPTGRTCRGRFGAADGSCASTKTRSASRSCCCSWFRGQDTRSAAMPTSRPTRSSTDSRDRPSPTTSTSSRFWFESFQNWQSEFLSIAAMVWLAVYLRQRGSPESKPVHASHDSHD